MIGHHLLVLYRSLMRQRLAAALNVASLAVGLMVFLLLSLAVAYESGFDRWLPGSETVHRLDTRLTLADAEPVEDATTPFISAPLLRKDFPEVQAITRIAPAQGRVVQRANTVTEPVLLADPELFQVLDLPFAAGDRRTALATATDLVVTESFARKHFGTSAALGRELTFREAAGLKTYRVSAVLKDLPSDTSLAVNAVARLLPTSAPEAAFQSWTFNAGFIYAKLAPGSADSVNRRLDAFLTRYAAASMGPRPTDSQRLRFVPLRGLHFADVAVNDAMKPGVDRLFVTVLGVMGVLTLLVAVVNYVNLSTARAGLRAREVAMRKVMGATRGRLIAQFMAEAVVLSAVAAVIGLALAELALPAANALLGADIRIRYLGEGSVLPLVAVVVAATALGAGAYPALALSAFRPAAVLASARAPGGGRAGARVRAALVVAQFAASIAMAVCTLVIVAQTRYVREADRGFRREGLMLVRGLAAPEMTARRKAFVDALGALPGVVSATASYRSPGDTDSNTGTFHRPGATGKVPELEKDRVADRYFETYGARIVAGRAFDNRIRLDDTAGREQEDLKRLGFNVMLNESAARSLGFAGPADAVGQTLEASRLRVPVTVIGVVADMRYLSPRERPAAVVYSHDSSYARTAALRFRGDPVAMRRRVEALWRSFDPTTPPRVETVDAALNAFYAADERRGQLFAAGAVLAMLVGCVGLYGLAAFSTARRVKEIGVRKTLGASTVDVLRLLLGQLLRPVLLANLVAWPLAWAAMRGWLSGFDQKVSLDPGYFLTAGAGALAVAMATVLGHALHVARAEPTRALRYE